MKSNTKSSITLPSAELKLVKDLQRRLGAKTKVEVIRLGLKKLKESTDREYLKQAYEAAAKQVSGTTRDEIAELDSLSDEGVD